MCFSTSGSGGGEVKGDTAGRLDEPPLLHCKSAQRLMLLSTHGVVVG